MGLQKYQVLVSFHASDPSTTATPVHPIDVKRPCTTKLDEFAAVCSNSSSLPRRRSTDPGGSYDERAWQCQIVNMRMTGVSRELFLAIKQTVSGFEAVCGRMMQLVSGMTTKPCLTCFNIGFFGSRNEDETSYATGGFSKSCQGLQA